MLHPNTVRVRSSYDETRVTTTQQVLHRNARSGPVLIKRQGNLLEENTIISY
jgi:hypothetical protein